MDCFLSVKRYRSPREFQRDSFFGWMFCAAHGSLVSQYSHMLWSCMAGDHFNRIVTCPTVQKTGAFVAQVGVIDVAEEVASNISFQVALIIGSISCVLNRTFRTSQKKSHLLDVAFGNRQVHTHASQPSFFSSSACSQDFAPGCDTKSVEASYTSVQRFRS